MKDNNEKNQIENKENLNGILYKVNNQIKKGLKEDEIDFMEKIYNEEKKLIEDNNFI